MNLKLTVYTDDTLTDVKRVVETDELKIPYRVTGYLLQSMENLSLDDYEGMFNFVAGNMEVLDKIIKATFGVSELELECINTTELVSVGMEIAKWVMDKVSTLKKGNNQKNVEVTAQSLRCQRHFLK